MLIFLIFDGTTNVPISNTYMKHILAAFPETSPSLSERPSLVRKRQYGEIIGLSKQIAEKASEDPEQFERIKGILVQQLAHMRDEEEVNDPVQVKAKGRPRNKRLKNAMEIKTERTRGSRCGKCGEDGHNVRTCRR